MFPRLVTCSGLLICLLASVGSLRADGKATFPPPVPLSDESGLGVNVQRTMTLLATSTPEQHNKVRILFYGQSITEQEWSKQVADDLRKRFPHADLDIQNRAIGGFASQLLIRPAEHDLYPFYPDLVIFHVYGGNNEYEQIIKNTRSRTTAEVLMQKDHVTQWPPAVIDDKKDKGAWWDNLMNHHILPDIAKKYGCGLVDVRGPWLDYLKAQKLEPKALLKDGVHLNDHGNFLMAELVKRYLVYRPKLPNDSWKETVRTLEIGKDLSWKDGKLTLTFEGNRIDALAAKSAAKPVKAHILVDGKKPSEFPELTYIPRPTPGPWSPLALTRVDREKPPLLEDWKLKITEVNPDSSVWHFEVTGSRTGADGDGSSDKPFVSKSGRVKIALGAFFRNGKVPVGYEINWKVLPHYVDEYEAPSVSDATREYPTTLAQGLENKKHTLEIRCDDNGQSPIRYLRVYRPPVK